MSLGVSAASIRNHKSSKRRIFIPAFLDLPSAITGTASF
jgi:hypothetical protein